MRAKDELRRMAESAGFDRVGVTRLARAGTGGALLRWLARGDHAGMRYLSRRVEKRLDPRSILPGARSALCVALRYAPLTAEPDPANDLWPGVARYARGRDYHDVMLGRLERLEEEIREAFPGIGTRRYVDTGPVLERDLAASAGLGAFGKNCNLLDPETGSWCLLGEILTTLELESDTPVADLCGSCTECLDACPTGALTGPYALDSRLCISYWTIEHRGAIPHQVRASLGGWVFGCDVCQEVCPANLDVTAFERVAFELPAERREVDLSGLLSLSRDEYVEAFRGSPMKRAKLGGLQRNSAVAMGNSRSGRYLEPLLAALENEDAVVRGHAAWALARIDLENEAQMLGRRGALERALDQEDDREARAEIESALDLLPPDS